MTRITLAGLAAATLLALAGPALAQGDPRERRRSTTPQQRAADVDGTRAGNQTRGRLDGVREGGANDTTFARTRATRPTGAAATGARTAATATPEARRRDRSAAGGPQRR